MADLDIPSLKLRLREQCSFKDISAIMTEHTPIETMRFLRPRRLDRAHTRFGGMGQPVKPWYIPTEEVEHFPGWTATMSYEPRQGHSWTVRAIIQRLGVFNGDENMLVDIKGNGRVFGQDIVLFAQDFPGMWLADKLRGHLE